MPAGHRMGPCGRGPADNIDRPGDDRGRCHRPRYDARPLHSPRGRPAECCCGQADRPVMSVFTGKELPCPCPPAPGPERDRRPAPAAARDPGVVPRQPGPRAASRYCPIRRGRIAARQCPMPRPKIPPPWAPSGDAQTREWLIACPENQDIRRPEGWQWLFQARPPHDRPRKWIACRQASPAQPAPGDSRPRNRGRRRIPAGVGCGGGLLWHVMPYTRQAQGHQRNGSASRGRTAR